MGQQQKKERKENTALDNINQEKFCILYATERGLMGNGTQCYAIAYGIDLASKKGYATCRANSHRLLIDADITARITELLTDEGFNDENVAKQHLFLINQDADLSAKKGGVELFYKLKGKLIEKQKVEGNLVMSWEE